MEDITAQSGESSSLGVLDGDDVIYVARSAAPHRLMAITLSVGTRLPAAHTSMGRVLLAHLPADMLNDYFERLSLQRYTEKTITDKKLLKISIDKVRQQGYAISDQELDSGLRSVAVPVFDLHDKLIGAINISTNAARVDMDKLLKAYLPLLQQKAQLIRQTVSI